MKAQQSIIPFRKNAAAAIKDQTLRQAMRTATDVFTTKRAAGLASIPIEEWRDQASEIRVAVLKNLTGYLDTFSAAATRAGAIVHRARDAEVARDMALNILKDRHVRKVVKAKSMVTEEIHLNPYLESRGIEVIETDLGEYIVQIAGETPSHILAPAIHKNRRQIGELFSRKLGVAFSDDPTILTRIARDVLRNEFLTADAGMSGANFAVAESGTLAIFTNEGNGRMVTTLPPLHVAVISMEKMIPSVPDLAPFIRLLPRSATGQMLSSYLSLITGTRKPGENTGARELHIIILDNGRTGILGSEYWEILKCIRCSACMNVCPVYRAVGGHAYGSTYPGPMGIVLTTLLEGMGKAHPLIDATTLCGACVDACPVRVPLKKLLTMLREQRARDGFTPATERAAMEAFKLAVRHPTLFAAGQSTARLFWPLLRALAPQGSADRLPIPAEETFSRRKK